MRVIIIIIIGGVAVSVIVAMASSSSSYSSSSSPPHYSVFRRYLHSIIIETDDEFNKYDDINLLISLIETVAKFIDIIRRTEEGFISSKSLKQAESLSLEGCLVITVIFFCICSFYLLCCIFA